MIQSKVTKFSQQEAETFYKEHKGKMTFFIQCMVLYWSSRSGCPRVEKYVQKIFITI